MLPRRTYTYESRRRKTTFWHQENTKRSILRVAFNRHVYHSAI